MYVNVYTAMLAWYHKETTHCMLLSLSAYISYSFNLNSLKDWPVSNKSDIKEIDNYRFNENSLEKKEVDWTPR